MAGNTFGNLFKVTNWGESHGPAIGAVVDGCPSNLKISTTEIQKELNRRRPGQSEVSTPRKERDRVEILSGVLEGKTTGTPISLMIRNKDYKSEDYSTFTEIYRPGHADYTYKMKFGIRDPFGGGRSSARITAGHVAAGAIAKKYLNEKYNIQITGFVKKVKDISVDVDPLKVEPHVVENNIVRCPDPKIAKEMIKLIEDHKERGESVGGIIECCVKNVPVGLGEPVFSKLNADLAHAIMSINATKGFEIGDGFGVAELTGSQNNDEFTINENGTIKTKTNHAGGIYGGISSGMPLIFRVAFKPVPTIGKEQNTVNEKGEKVKLAAKGRHDPCVVPRAVPIVEAMTAITLMDHVLMHQSKQ